jgi:hypothetical protein
MKKSRSPSLKSSKNKSISLKSQSKKKFKWSDKDKGKKSNAGLLLKQRGRAKTISKNLPPPSISIREPE